MRKRLSEQERALREFACGICKKTVVDPVSTPCGAWRGGKDGRGVVLGGAARRRGRFMGGHSRRLRGLGPQRQSLQGWPVI